MLPSVFRFAPSPNGYLHLGHALSALMNFDMAKATGGRFLLRIEDIDAARCRPEFEAAIYEDLAWLGIVWEQSVRRQSQHFDDYRAALKRLDAEGLLYPSFESRAEIVRLIAARDGGDEADGKSWPCDPDGVPLYPGNGKRLPAKERTQRMAAGGNYALRLDMTRAQARTGSLTWNEIAAAAADAPARLPATPERWGDVVLARKDVPTSYHLSVVVDDALQGVTHVVRGQDLRAATGVHRVLQALLGLPAPTYCHHRLVLDANGRKLAKSNGATALRALRAKGAAPADIRRLVGLT